MPRIALIGYGAMAGYVAAQLDQTAWSLSHCIIRQGREDAARARLGADVTLVSTLDEITALPDLVVDCAGHPGLIQYGRDVLRAGIPVVTASIGALADDTLRHELATAATDGQSHLHLATGAIGALDALRAASVGGLTDVRYTGIKPPSGWRGTPAEQQTDLDALTAPFIHFEGTARHAARLYPKNANVAAAVAFAGAGFDTTTTKLMADPAATGNTHQIHAKGAFGQFDFTITGNSLPDTPRTSALAAMSMVAAILDQTASIKS